MADSGEIISQSNEVANEKYDSQWLVGTSAEKLLKKCEKKFICKEIKTPKEETGINKATNTEFSDPVFKKLSKVNGKINNMSVDELTDTVKRLNLDSTGKMEVLKKRLKSYYKLNALTEKQQKSSNKKTNKRPLEYACVIDYEATCSENKINYPHEIIEFPVVLVNLKTLKIEDEFQAYCKPVINPKLTDFCVKLTGITQENVDKADEFPIVLEKVEQWLRDHELGSKYKFVVATDGPWDMQNFLNLQCSHSDINYPYWARRWMDVRKIFSNFFSVRRCGIEKMLDYFELTFEGRQHCGLDDAKNIAKILIKIIESGYQPEINSRIKRCLTDMAKCNLKNKRIEEASGSQFSGDSSSDNDLDDDEEKDCDEKRKNKATEKSTDSVNSDKENDQKKA